MQTEVVLMQVRRGDIYYADLSPVVGLSLIHIFFNNLLCFLVNTIMYFLYTLLKKEGGCAKMTVCAGDIFPL